MQACFDIFFERHLSNTFCGFVYCPDLENYPAEAPFLSTAITCLCARYLSGAQAKEYFGLQTGEEASHLYTPIARSLARATLDEPSVQNIQGNLVLSLSEFFDNEGSSHWMYAGTAIRMAQIMRLNKEYHQSHSLKDQEIRRRTFWACVLVDKLLAYFLTKPAAICGVNISSPLPGTDASLAYQEPTRGLTLQSIESFAGFPSDVGILPYLIKTIWHWGDMSALNTCNHRFVYKIAPTDPASPFHQRHDDMRRWSLSLPQILQWSDDSYSNHSSLGHGKDFIAMHFLIRSASCVAHQAYLPQLDGSSILVEIVDAAGWSLLHRDSGLVDVCVTSALETAELATKLIKSGAKTRSDLQSVWVAASLFIVSNTLLWIQYSNDAQYGTATLVQDAERGFDTALQIMSLWEGHWTAASQWLNTLRAMRAMYRAAYLGDVDQSLVAEAAVPSSSPESSKFRPRPCDGFISLHAASTLSESLRFLASDTSVEPKRLQTVWTQFATGWPHDFVGDDLYGTLQS
ncbi:zinc finger transcription factor 1, partial [Metarhizium majus ARSEF 297]